MKKSLSPHGDSNTEQQKPIRRVAVAEPPIEDFYYTYHRGSGLGIRSVARICEHLGKNAILFHFPTAAKSTPIPLPSSLDHIKPFINPNESGPLSFFTSYNRFGPSFDICAKQIAEANPDIIFLSCFAFCYAHCLIALARECKRVLPNIPIAAGGAGVTARPEFFRNSPAVDFAVPGEAEIVLPPFFGEATAGTPRPLSIWSKTGDTKKRAFFSTAITRGCPKTCRFCSVRLSHPGGLRRMAKQNILTGFKDSAASASGKNMSINFEDDNLLADWDHTIDIITAIKAQRPDAAFTAENGMDYTFLDSEKIKALIDLGFYRFNFSLGVYGAENLERQRRHGDLQLLKELVRLAAEKGKQCTVFFICGFPGDSPENSVHTLLFLHALPVKTGISLYYPVPGLKEISIPDDTPPALCAGSSAYPWSGALSTAQLITAFRLARLSNFLKTAEKAAAGIRDIPFLDSGMIETFSKGVQLDTTNPLS